MLGCFVTWDGRLLDFWASIADAWWNNIVAQADIYIYLYIFIYVYKCMIQQSSSNCPNTARCCNSYRYRASDLLCSLCTFSCVGCWLFLSSQELTPWWRRISWVVCLKHWMKKRWGWPRMAGEMLGKQESLEIEPFKRCVPKIPEWPRNSWHVQEILNDKFKWTCCFSIFI